MAGVKKTGSNRRSVRPSYGSKRMLPIVMLDPLGMHSSLDLPQFFSTQMVRELLLSAPADYGKLPADEQDQMRSTASMVIGAYLLMVYRLYPENEEFRMAVDSNKELSSNFRKVSRWLDQHNGRRLAEARGLELGLPQA